MTQSRFSNLPKILLSAYLVALEGRVVGIVTPVGVIKMELIPKPEENLLIFEDEMLRFDDTPYQVRVNKVGGE